MNEIFQNNDDFAVMAQYEFIPVMYPEFAPEQNDGYYIFYKLNFLTLVMTKMKEEEARAFYKTLTRRQERIDLWGCMRTNGWTKLRKSEEDLIKT